MAVSCSYVRLAPAAPQRAVLTTDGAGAATWTFPVPYTSPPVITATVIDPTLGDGTHYSVEVVAPTTTGVAVKVVQTTTTTVLGIELLRAPTPAASAVVHVTAIPSA